MSPAFADLRIAQILAGIHFGRPAADAIGVLFRARQQVFAAVTGRFGGSFSDFYFPDAQRVEQHREFEVSMQRLPGGAPSRGRHARRDRPGIPANRCSTHGAGKCLSAVLGRPALAEEAVQLLAKARTWIRSSKASSSRDAAGDASCGSSPGAAAHTVQPVSLPGVVQREIDGVPARNHRAPVRRKLADLDAVGFHPNVSPECPRAGDPN